MASLIAPPGVATAGMPAFRRLPHNVDAERGLLGAIFLDNRRAYEMVAEFLRPEHFALNEHSRIFQACVTLIERGQTANPVTLGPYFQQNGVLEDIGGTPYLVELADQATTVMNAGEYGRIIHELYLRRELIAVGEEITEHAYDAELDEPASRQIEQAEQHLYNLATTGDYQGGFSSFRDSLQSAITMAETAYKRSGLIVGVPTGFRDLDGKLGGLHPSDLIILAGRPSMGKTALATNIAFNAARARMENGADDGAVVAFFSLEMSEEQLATRILGERARIPSDQIRKGMLNEEKFLTLAQVSQDLYRIPMFIDDTPGLGISAMRTRARRLKRQHGLGLIVIDYLQLITPANKRYDSRVQELSEITRGLKGLAKELDIPVLALSQLSRAVEQREDKRPQLADLRESGTIEQDADVVMFIFREQYYLERGEPMQRADEDLSKFLTRHDKWKERCETVHNTAEVIVAKQRHGPIGTVRLYFEGEFTRFGDLEPRAD
ncbi:MAG: replicative DNA helicase, partial [Rhodospirillales bacterium]